ncbi:MAG: hypothetical protein ACREVL_14555 [Solimonas sp.]
MAAICDACNWTGSATAVRDGGKCPGCGEPIRYDSKPLTTAPRLTLHTFLPRAAKALRAIGAGDGDDFVESALSRIECGHSIAPVTVAILLKVILRRAAAINDRAVVDFAAMHARGAD